jgi:hypothetical protein
MNDRFACISLLLASLVGCSSEPFVRGPLPVLHHPDAEQVATNVRDSVADTFYSEDSVIISAPFHDDLAVLGVLQVDRKAGTFELVGLNQLGLELFHLSGDHQTVIIRSAVPPLMEQKDVLMSIGQDVRRMYFHVAPPADANYEVKETYIRYERNPVLYEVGGHPSILLEKRVESTVGDQWKIRYFDYADANGRLYPRGIVMDNGDYHYRIVVKNRTWQAD